MGEIEFSVDNFIRKHDSSPGLMANTTNPSLPKPPTFSVIMPCYNAQTFCSAAIQSILDQSYQNLELLLIDDGSTDETFKVLRSFSEKDSRIRLFQKTNGGDMFLPLTLGWTESGATTF